MGVMTKAAAQGRAPQDNFKAVHCIVVRLDLQDSAKLDARQCKTRCRTVQNWLVPEQQLYLKQTLQYHNKMNASQKLHYLTSTSLCYISLFLGC